jgi:hypothetical protein
MHPRLKYTMFMKILSPPVRDGGAERFMLTRARGTIEMNC